MNITFAGIYFTYAHETDKLIDRPIKIMMTNTFTEARHESVQTLPANCISIGRKDTYPGGLRKSQRFSEPVPLEEPYTTDTVLMIYKLFSKSAWVKGFSRWPVDMQLAVNHFPNQFRFIGPMEWGRASSTSPSRWICYINDLSTHDWRIGAPWIDACQDTASWRMFSASWLPRVSGLTRLAVGIPDVF